MIRRLLQIGVILVVANALYHVVPVTMHYFQFKDAVQELALFAERATDAQLVDRVMAAADEHSIPLDRNYVSVRRVTGQLFIAVSYVDTMKVVPGYEYVKQYDFEVKAFNDLH